MLERTRAGRYDPLKIKRGLSAAWLVKHFERRGLAGQLKPALRAVLEVRELNLAEPWTQIPPLDVIFIRNVLIYFDNEMKKLILRKLRQVLRSGGNLFLGDAETTLNLDNAFTCVNYNKTLCDRV